MTDLKEKPSPNVNDVRLYFDVCELQRFSEQDLQEIQKIYDHIMDQKLLQGGDSDSATNPDDYDSRKSTALTALMKFNSTQEIKDRGQLSEVIEGNLKIKGRTALELIEVLELLKAQDDRRTAKFTGERDA